MEFSELFTQLLIDLQSVFRKNNKNLPISFSQVVLLVSIPADGITMSALAKRVGVDNSTLTRLIKIMNEKEYSGILLTSPPYLSISLVCILS